eukprot:6187616-Pleurochrysis_carterae.AAC.1
MQPSAASDGFEWALVWVVPIKDAAARHKAAPMPLRRRQREGPRGSDPLCAFDALWVTWHERADGVPVAERTFGTRSSTPLFVGSDGVLPWSSADSRRLAQAMASEAGLDPNEFGGKAWRIGGATDLRDVLGDSGAAAIQQRGRWASDVAQVYQRAVVDGQLRTSAAMATSTGVDLEALCTGWTQPATFRG